MAENRAFTDIEYLTNEFISMRAASRIAQGDPTLFDFSAKALESASNSMGWTDLCANPPIDPSSIAEFASSISGEGLSDLFLIGVGGTMQAAVAMATFLESQGKMPLRFHAMDSTLPSDIVNELAGADFAHSAFIVSSKSGTTVDTMAIFEYVWRSVCSELGRSAANRFIAITDAGTRLEESARERGISKVFNGEGDIGGRYSALSVVGLLPFALMGIDVVELVDRCRSCEALCGLDDPSNPAISLAAGLVSLLYNGRDIMHLAVNQGSLGFGLWAAQLVCESLGKQGKGILVSVEPGFRLLSEDDENGFSIIASSDPSLIGASLSVDIPHLHVPILTGIDLAMQFIIWEYAISMIAIMLEVDPFNQPNVEAAKKAARAIWRDEISLGMRAASTASLALPCERDATQGEALAALFSMVEPGDYCAIDAFLPRTSESIFGRLKTLRRMIFDGLGCPTCLEMGPRYLHSIGQYQKGGPNKGLFLIVSAEDSEAGAYGEVEKTLDNLTYAQAAGDFAALSERERRVVHVNLPRCDADALDDLLDLVAKCLP